MRGFMKRRIAILLCAALPLCGCRTWDVRAFGQPLQAQEPHGAGGFDLTLEEQLGIVLVLAVGIAGIVAATR